MEHESLSDRYTTYVTTVPGGIASPERNVVTGAHDNVTAESSKLTIVRPTGGEGCGRDVVNENVYGAPIARPGPHVSRALPATVTVYVVLSSSPPVDTASVWFPGQLKSRAGNGGLTEIADSTVVRFISSENEIVIVAFGATSVAVSGGNVGPTRGGPVSIRNVSLSFDAVVLAVSVTSTRTRVTTSTAGSVHT
jgi:hypothetical protein